MNHFFRCINIWFAKNLQIIHDGHFRHGYYNSYYD